VLGCNFSAGAAVHDQVDGYMFIGDGLFHPIGVALAFDKPVLVFDPFANKFQELGSLKDKLLRQRHAAIAKATTCTNFGILITTKAGQNRFKYAYEMKNKLERNSTKATILMADTFSPEQLNYLVFDAYVNTACPRLTIDDYKRYKKVIITPIELEIVLGERSWEQYKFDEIR
jgi:2-(3-amino-3-carboxypropyl)histidine synthase